MHHHDAAPSEPLNLRVEGLGAAMLYVTWQAPVDNGGRPITGYRITLIEFNNLTSFTIIDVGNETYNFIIQDVGLTENTTYM